MDKEDFNIMDCSVEAWFALLLILCIPVIGILLSLLCISKKQDPVNMFKAALVIQILFVIFLLGHFGFREAPKKGSSVQSTMEANTTIEVSTAVTDATTIEDATTVEDTTTIEDATTESVAELKKYGTKDLLRFQSGVELELLENSAGSLTYASTDKNYNIVIKDYGTQSVEQVHKDVKTSVLSQLGENPYELEEEDSAGYGKKSWPCRYSEFVLGDGSCIDLLVFTKKGRTYYLGLSYGESYAEDALQVKYNFR